MRNISLNNGHIVTIMSDKDLLEVIAENLSYELAKYIEEEIIYNQYGISEYIDELEKTNDELLKENHALKMALNETGKAELTNDSYFNYLRENVYE